ncbi:MAG: 50S ribosomal protein L9 [Armatimonadetes bacterium]|nr:50S ribosomal protein L9 [Armatimonadota bacterium]
MQVILLEDVERVGHEGDLLKVSDGYARNYLIPRKLAVLATRGALKDLENRQGAIARRDSEKREAAQVLADQLKDKLIIVKHVTGEGTKLHGTVTTAQIAEAATAQLDIKLDKRDLELPEPIREVGDYLVSARVYKDVHAQLPIRVVPEKKAHGEEEDEAAEVAAEAVAEAIEEAEETEEADEADVEEAATEEDEAEQ